MGFPGNFPLLNPDFQISSRFQSVRLRRGYLMKTSLDIDPRKWVKPVNLEELYQFPTDDHTLAIQKTHDVLPALIVGFWVPKEETEELFDDPGVILELYDGSSKKNKNNSFVEKHYAQAFRIKKQERRIPTAFVKISENADLKYNYHIEELLGSKNETKVRVRVELSDCCRIQMSKKCKNDFRIHADSLSICEKSKLTK